MENAFYFLKFYIFFRGSLVFNYFFFNNGINGLIFLLGSLKLKVLRVTWKI